MKEKNYFRSIDLLRAVATIAVVGIHTTSQTLSAASLNINEYAFSLFIDQVLRFTVPLFFLISGFGLAISYSKTGILTFYKKRLSKIIIPYLFWSLFYWNFVYVNHGETFWAALLKGSASYQLYFIPSLFILYLLFPLIYRFWNFITNRFILLSLFIIQMSLLYHEYFIKEYKFHHSLRVASLNFFIFILGIWGARNYKKIYSFAERYKYFFITGTIICALYVFFEGRNLYLKHDYYLYIYSQWRPSVLIYTIILAATLFFIFEKTNYKNKFLDIISRLSFFIYFSHIFFLEKFWHLVGKYTFATPLFDIWFLASILSLSLIAGYVIHKIPKLATLTG